MKEEDKPSIEPTKNGPYRVLNLKNLKNSKGKAIEARDSMFMCRCGGSNNKPFCDGTHARKGFTDEKKPDRLPDKLETYEGKEIAIHDNRGVCSHRGNCTDNLPGVFRMKEEPWIDPDGEDAEKISGLIRTCPSGALSYSKDGVQYKDYDRKPGLTVSKDGPYDAVGYIELRDPRGGNRPESKEHFTLCRCGHSKNKPFCSGEHWYVKFRDPKN